MQFGFHLISQIMTNERPETSPRSPFRSISAGRPFGLNEHTGPQMLSESAGNLRVGTLASGSHLTTMARAKPRRVRQTSFSCAAQVRLE